MRVCEGLLNVCEGPRVSFSCWGFMGFALLPPRCVCVCVCVCACEWGPHRGGCPLGEEWSSEHLLGGPEHEVRVDLQEVGIKMGQDQGVGATMTLRSGFQGCPWARGCWGWEMAQQAEVRPAGRSPDL